MSDMSEYLGVFLDEAEEQVQVLDDGLLRLEKDPDNKELIQEIFRAAHSLKSASAAMGFTTMSQLTHAAENILEKIRSDEMMPDSAVIDTLLTAVDALKSIKDAIRSGQSDEHDIADLLSLLQSACSAAPKDAPVVEQPIQEPESTAAQRETDDPSNQESIHEVQICLSADCEMKSMRAQVVFCALERVGKILRVTPSREEISENWLGREFSVIVSVRGGEVLLHDIFSHIPEIDSYEIESDPRLKDAGPAARDKTPGEISTLAKKVESDQTIRVSVSRLDSLMNLVGELVIDRTRVTQLGQELEAKYGNIEIVDSLRETARHMARIVGDLQEEVMKTRLLPIAQLFRRFPRMVRDLAQKVGKDIDIVLEGEDTELDRSVIEEMVDPLSHLLRNSIDHGIESPEERLRAGKTAKGNIRLVARQEENHVIIEVVDDGKGMDVEKIKASALARGVISETEAATLSQEATLQLIFASGLSTAEKVSDLSGRGVGMDVVKNNVTRLHGTVRVKTEPGKGSTLAIRLPLTLAISQALLVAEERATVAIPLVYVVETTRVPRDTVKSVNGRHVITFRDRVLPLVSLNQVLGRTSGVVECGGGQVRIVVVRSGNKDMGIMVDNLLGEQEIVLKPLGTALGDIAGMSGATILGNGTVAMVVDVAGLIEHTGINAATTKAWKFVGSDAEEAVQYIQ